MKWLSYPALLLLRELGVVGMLRSLLGIALASGAMALWMPAICLNQRWRAVSYIVWAPPLWMSIANISKKTPH